jgi:hypothetical protein
MMLAFAACFPVLSQSIDKDNGTLEKGILPFTGIRYVNEGIWGKKIDVTLDGSTWISNRIPLDAEMKIKIEDPTGFMKDIEGKSYPGIEILILGTNGDSLGHAPDLFGDNSAGVDEFILRSLTVTLGFSEGVMPGDTLLQHIRFFDKKSSNTLKLFFPVVIAYEGEPSQTSNSIYGAKSFVGFDGKATGVELKDIATEIDSTDYPASLSHNIRVVNLEGTSVEEVRGGTFTLFAYDKDLQELPMYGSKKSYSVNSGNGATLVNILAKLPFKPSDPVHEDHIVRLRWESSDGKKVIDIVSRILK